MATRTALKKVAVAIAGMSNAIANTFVESAHEIASTCQEAFGGSVDIEKDDIAAIQDMVTETSAWKGTTSEGARRSEVKSIVLAYPYIERAAKVFKREFGELRREHFVKLARMCPEYVTPTDAAFDCVAFFESRGKGRGNAKPKNPEEAKRAAITGGLRTAINAADPELKKALYRLCKRFEITFG